VVKPSQSQSEAKPKLHPGQPRGSQATVKV